MMTSFPPFNKHIYLGSGGGTPSESHSEISSVDSDWSDLRSIAAQLGVANPDDLHTERFKIDRQKLEEMIKTDAFSEGMNTAEQFFTNIMKETSTHISWPCRLKIGAKTKKDPHVRIVGKQEDVLNAKDKIMVKLDSRGSRVIMKMDVSYTDHSYIIGRGGNNIKRIMEDTATHIHFPDSNRSNPTEKSNQVSLCGSIEGVEKARALVRASTPILISFELPILAPGRPVPDNDTPKVKEIEKEYNVQVIFSTRPKLHSSLVLVKGSEKEVLKVKEATNRLIDYMCENIAGQIPVQMQLEISTQHHPIVLGRASGNLREIMSRTGTQIMFPDANDVNIKPIKRSQVTITGSISGVYMARQQLIGSLPIALIFDYPDNSVDSEQITKLMYSHDVFITVRQKSRQSTLCIVVKGIEKFISNIYEARHQLLNLTSPRIQAEIPATYLAPNEKSKNSNCISVLLASGAAQAPFSPLSPINPIPFLKWPTPMPQNEFQQLQNLRHQMSQLTMPGNSGFVGQSTKIQAAASNLFHQHIQQQQQQQQHKSFPFANNNNNMNSRTGGNHHNFQLRQPPQQPNLQLPLPSHLLSPKNTSDIHSSGYQSLNCSTNSLDQQHQSSSSTSSIIHTSPDTTTATTSTTGGGVGSGENMSHQSGNRNMSYGDSPTFNNGNNSHMNETNETRSPIQQQQKQQQQLQNQLQHQHQQRHHNDVPKISMNDSFVFNFDPRVIAGYKAMHVPPQGEIRTPTPIWQGLGLSQTSPLPLDMSDCSWNSSGHDAMLNMTTTMIDVTPTTKRHQMAQYNDIASILTSLGLEHHIQHFINGEIDMTVFPTLTDQDLINLGIKPLGARRRILMAVHDYSVRKRISPSSSRFSGSAAPGAERRTSNGH